MSSGSNSEISSALIFVQSSYIDSSLFLIPLMASTLKSASCNNSAEIRIVSRIGSAPYFLTASLSGIIFPIDFDIFFPPIRTEPLTTISCGQFSSGKSATWFKTKNVRWFGTRSLPECLASTG